MPMKVRVTVPRAAPEPESLHSHSYLLPHDIQSVTGRQASTCLYTSKRQSGREFSVFVPTVTVSKNTYILWETVQRHNRDKVKEIAKRKQNMTGTKKYNMNTQPFVSLLFLRDDKKIPLNKSNNIV